ncbi:cation:proton antiporter [Exiguobacterium undae]|uniref:cation:proton antiporter n=1 Tax=Exiguobacterium undae TaxID=169177 RepID=UPI00047D552D|nr:cation:proton antiporter [Exiguobacterium undae]
MINSFIGLSIIVITCFILREVSSFFRQPKVIGEMVSGIIIGICILQSIFPSFFKNTFNDETMEILKFLGQFGLLFYMFLIGNNLTHNVNGDKSVIQDGYKLALAGIVPTFSILFIASFYVYDVLDISISTQLSYSIFMAACISVTAFPMIVKTLEEYDLLETRLGKSVTIAGSFDDLIAWMFLPILISFVSEGKFNLVNGFFRLLIIFSIIFISIYIVKKLIKKIFYNLSSSVIQLQLSIVIIILYGVIFEYLGLHYVIGGFLAGCIIPTKINLKNEFKNSFSSIINFILLPCYFFISGLSVNFSGITDRYSYLIIFNFIFLSFLTKYLGGLLCAKYLKFSWGEASAVGALINSRGFIIIIFAQIGVENKIITNEEYSIMYLIAIITTMLMSPIFKMSLIKITKKNNLGEKAYKVS